MNKRTVLVGVVVLVVGVALVIGGGIGALDSLTISTTYTQPQTGEYVSSEIVLNTTSNLVVSSPAATGGIVLAQNLSKVNSNNINSYVVPYSASAAGSYVYKGLGVGDYYYVAFSPSQPNSKIVATPQGSLAIAFGLLVLLGIVLALVGVIIAVVGAVRKNPHPAPAQP